MLTINKCLNFKRHLQKEKTYMTFYVKYIIINKKKNHYYF